MKKTVILNLEHVLKLIIIVENYETTTTNLLYVSAERNEFNSLTRHHFFFLFQGLCVPFWLLKYILIDSLIYYVFYASFFFFF